MLATQGIWEQEVTVQTAPQKDAENYGEKLMLTEENQHKNNMISTCKYKKVEIIAGAVCADHVHLCVSIPPKIGISDFVGVPKREVGADDLRQAPRDGKQVGQKFLGKGVLRSHRWQFLCCSHYTPISSSFASHPLR